MYNIHLLPALFGDAILIEYGVRKPYYILIDGGPYYGYAKMMEGLKRVAPNLKELELLVITHIDIDHIDGTISLLNQSPLPFKIKEVWFNGYEQLTKKDITGSTLGALQGEYLSRLIQKHKLSHNSHFGGSAVVVRDTNNLPVVKLKSGFEIKLLSPSVPALRKLNLDWKKEIEKIEEKGTVEERWKKEKRYGSTPASLLGSGPDKSIANLSSIAFIGNYKGKSCLFAGDAPSEALLPAVQALKKAQKKEKLSLDAWKLAHHGSKRSTVQSIIDEIRSRHILVSCNGAIHHLPDAACINAVLKSNSPCEVYFNYLSDYNKSWKDAKQQQKMGYTAHYPGNSDGISVKLQ